MCFSCVDSLGLYFCLCIVLFCVEFVVVVFFFIPLCVSFPRLLPLLHNKHRSFLAPITIQSLFLIITFSLSLSLSVLPVFHHLISSFLPLLHLQFSLQSLSLSSVPLSVCPGPEELKRGIRVR